MNTAARALVLTLQACLLVWLASRYPPASDTRSLLGIAAALIGFWAAWTAFTDQS